MTKDPVDIDTNQHYRNMEMAEKEYEAKAEFREALFDNSKETLFFEEMLEKNSMMFSESELINGDDDCKIQEAITHLYNSLPMINGLRPTSGLSHTESCAWDLIEAIFENDNVSEYLINVLACRGIQK